MLIGKLVNNVRQRYLPEGSFRKDFITLSVGRIVSQAIPLLLTPVLTRLYSPEDFGVYAIFLSLVSVVSLLSNGRYNLAITLPKKLNKAEELLLICFIGVLSVSLLSFLVFLFFERSILQALALEGKRSFVYLVPIGIFIVAIIESVYYWMLRKRFYEFLSLSFIVNTSVATGLKILFAFLGGGWMGLIVAYIIGALLSLILLVGKFLKESQILELVRKLKKEDLLLTARKYGAFPTFSMPADGANSLAQQLPNVLLNNLFTGAIVGFYSLTQSVLGLPIKFISSAMTDVYRERASADCRDKGDCRRILLATLRNLTLFSIIPFLLLFLFAPTLVPFILGDQWVEVGSYIRILTPLFLFRFIASPLGATLYITGRQKYLLLWQMTLLLLTIASFYFGSLIGDEHTSLALFSASYSIMYIILIGLAYKFSSVTE
jgi:O-antigen/teichoic acid export membrane protein